MSRLVVFLTDALRTYHDKGEIKPRYYNPENLFSEVHFLSPARREIDPARVQTIVGDARLVIHAIGPLQYAPWDAVRRVGDILASIGPDLLRAYDSSLRGALAVYWGKRLGVPSVISIHADLDEQRRHERRLVHQLRIPLERYSLTGATKVMCVTHHVAHYAERHGAASPAVIYNRVDTRRFTPQPDVVRVTPGAGSPLSIVTVGRLVPPKFQECVIRAIATVHAQLTIIGDGSERPRLERLARDLGVRDRITFIPAVPNSEIETYYLAADVFAIATHYEGFCIPILEALACGMPVVASDIGAIREIVGDAGLLVKNDPHAFSTAFESLLSDPQLRHTLGTRARRRALTMDGAVMEKHEADLYRALLS